MKLGNELKELRSTNAKQQELIDSQLQTIQALKLKLEGLSGIGRIWENGWIIQDAEVFSPEDYVIVPKEPTCKMLVDCGTVDGFDGEQIEHSSGADEAHIQWYKAMIEASNE